jgi:hypothetical protein
VGCEKCHGGDAATFERFAAHRDILPFSNTASPVNRLNIPKTCGTCHVGPFVAFQKSHHFELLKAGNVRGPVCTTCHGNAGDWRPSPRGLESECASCHGAGKPAARPAYPVRARTMVEGIREARKQLDSARTMIARIGDRARRERLEQAAHQADVPLIEATSAGHAFVYDALEERLDTAQKRIAALFQQIANPR